MATSQIDSRLNSNVGLVLLSSFFAQSEIFSFINFSNEFIIFSALIHFPKLINHDSLVIIRITHYNSQFLIDIITILQHIFNSVHIVRNIMQLDIYIAKNIVCEGFNSKKLEKILPQLNKIYEHIINNTNDDDIINDIKKKYD